MSEASLPLTPPKLGTGDHSRLSCGLLQQPPLITAWLMVRVLPAPHSFEPRDFPETSKRPAIGGLRRRRFGLRGDLFGPGGDWAGGGFLGVHSATDTFYQWPEYRKIIGGYFDQHPWHQAVVVEVADRDEPLVAFLGETIAVTDEIYQIRDFDVGGSRVLLRLDPTSVDLTRPNVHRHPYGWPLAWTRSYGVGRVFYTALGHEEGMWRDPRFHLLLRNAVLWMLRKTA